MRARASSLGRSEFIARAAGAAAAWPLGALAQQLAMPVVGFLHVGARNAFSHIVAAFNRGLAKADFVEGRNVAVEIRHPWPCLLVPAKWPKREETGTIVRRGDRVKRRGETPQS